MNILVTGGAGFIGSHICEKLISGQNRIICIDNFSDYYAPRLKEKNIENLLGNKNFVLYRNDILDNDMLEKIFSSNEIELVIHLAARAGVRPSINNAPLYEKVNIAGTVNLLEFCRKYNVGKFIFASSSSVYGGNKKIPFSENDNVDFPVSPYAATKKAGELLCHSYSHLFGISVFCYRFFTVYGPRQRPEMAIHKFTDNIYKEKPIEVFGDGNSSRDYTYIDDVTDAIIANIDNIKGYEIFNLGNSSSVKLLDLIKIIERGLGKKASINFLPFAPGDVTATCADILKASKVLKYKPKMPIDKGVEKFIAWYIKQQKCNI